MTLSLSWLNLAFLMFAFAMFVNAGIRGMQNENSFWVGLTVVLLSVSSLGVFIYLFIKNRSRK